MNSVLRNDLSEVIESVRDFSNFKDKSILITGATGLIGSTLIKLLVEVEKNFTLNLKIIGLARNEEKAKRVFGNILNNKNVELYRDYAELPNIKFSYIIHTASPTRSAYFISNPVETLDTIIDGIRNVLNIAKISGECKMIYLSSMEEYGIPYQSGDVIDEEKIGIVDHMTLRATYPLGKRVAECYCKAYAEEYGIDTVIARLAQTFGAGVDISDNRMSMQFAKSALLGEDIILHTTGESISNYCYLSDAIQGILYLILKGKKGEAYNICNDVETRSVKEIAKLVSEEIMENQIKVLFDIPESNLVYGYAPTVKMYLTSKKIRSLGWQPLVDMRSAYIRLINYLKEEGVR